jgi:hypothetical protein
MEAYWNQRPDETLTPLQLAEKRHVLACAKRDRERMARLEEIDRLKTERKNAPDDKARRDCQRRIRAAIKDMEAENDHIMDLWRYWATLKVNTDSAESA